MGKSIAVLDACVLYPAPIRDFLLNLAARKLFYPKWSEQIHSEWMRNLISKRPDLRRHQLERTKRLMDEAFPDAKVVDFDLPDRKVSLPDPNDHHVLDAAIKSQARYIVTFNLKDFPGNPLKLYSISAISPDEFIKSLITLNSKEVTKAFQTQVANLKNPPMEQEEVLKILERNGLRATVLELRNRL